VKRGYLGGKKEKGKSRRIFLLLTVRILLVTDNPVDGHGRKKERGEKKKTRKCKGPNLIWGGGEGGRGNVV